jgi:AraC-like DNA-binding protein
MNISFFDSVDIKPFISSFFNNSPDLYAFAKDKQCRFTMVNNALLKRLGLSSESEILGKTDFDFFKKNIATLFQIEDQEVMETSTPILNRTWSVPNGKGSLDWYISSKYPLFEKNGQYLGYFGVMRGITKAGSILEPYAQMTDVINYIQANFSQQIEISILAEIVNLSVSQFERKFKKLFGMTPLKFINKVRVDNACDMLTYSYATLSAIALDCGFYDHSYFTKIFKKQMSVTPTIYREKFLT